MLLSNKDNSVGREPLTGSTKVAEREGKIYTLDELKEYIIKSESPTSAINDFTFVKQYEKQTIYNIADNYFMKVKLPVAERETKEIMSTAMLKMFASILDIEVNPKDFTSLGKKLVSGEAGEEDVKNFFKSATTQVAAPVTDTPVQPAQVTDTSVQAGPTFKEYSLDGITKKMVLAYRGKKGKGLVAVNKETAKILIEHNAIDESDLAFYSYIELDGEIRPIKPISDIIGIDIGNWK